MRGFNGKKELDRRCSRIAVRTKWFDEEIERALRGERGTVEVEIEEEEEDDDAAEASTVRISIRESSLPKPWPSQVVCLGCGMDTRPWRLEFPSAKTSKKASWFDVDSGRVLRAKARELDAAGADIPEGSFALAFAEEEEEELAGEKEESKKKREKAEKKKKKKKKRKKKVLFPLKVSSYVAVPADVSRPGELSAALARAGHDATKPTIFVAEGLLMYLGERGASACLSATAEACPPSPSSSTFLAVTITPAALRSAQERTSSRRKKRGLQEADATAASSDLLSAWNFSCDAAGLAALCRESGWSSSSSSSSKGGGIESIVSRSDMARRYAPLVGSRGFEYEVAEPGKREERGSLFFVARK